MKHIKQFFAILLTIALTVCLLPAEAMATDTHTGKVWKWSGCRSGGRFIRSMIPIRLLIPVPLIFGSALQTEHRLCIRMEKINCDMNICMILSED